MVAGSAKVGVQAWLVPMGTNAAMVKIPMMVMVFMVLSSLGVIFVVVTATPGPSEREERQGRCGPAGGGTTDSRYAHPIAACATMTPFAERVPRTTMTPPEPTAKFA